MEKVSVIIPVYNSATYLSQCIESVINQTYSNLEIIVVDDGSTDNSLEVCGEYLKKDSRIKLIKSSHNGPSTARNLGLGNATGYYIQFVDSDDIIEPDMCELLVEKAEGGGELIICGFKRVTGNKISKEVFIKSQRIDRRIELKKVFEKLYDKWLLNSVCNKLFIKEKINSRFNENFKIGEDLLFVIDYLRGITNIIINEKPLYIYNCNNNSLTQQVNYDTLLQVSYVKNNLQQFAKELFGASYQFSFKVRIKELLREIKLWIRIVISYHK